MERTIREVWEKRVERWQDSGLTAKEFAAERLFALLPACVALVSLSG